MIYQHTTPYAVVAFTEEAEPVEEEPVEEEETSPSTNSRASSSRSTTSEEDEDDTPSNTFSSTRDTGGFSNYILYYPFWVYATAPSESCASTGKNCPPTDPKKLAQYNAQQKHDAELVYGIGGLVIIVLIVIVIAGSLS